MKLNQVLFSFCATLGLMACQAKDERINRPNGNSDRPGDVQVMSTNESMQMLAVQIDRTAETLHVLRATLDSKYRDSYKITASQPLEASQLTARVDVSNIVLKSQNKDPDRKAKELTKLSNVNLTIKRLLIDQDGKLQQLVGLFEDTDGVKNAGLKYVSGAAVDFTSTLRSKSFSIEPIANEDSKYLVTHLKFEDTSSKKDRNSLVQTKLKFVLNWSGQMTDLSAPMLIDGLTLNVFRSGSKTGQIRVQTSPETVQKLSIELKDCSSINGGLSIQISEPVKGADGKTTFVWKDYELTAVDSSYAIANKLLSTSQECAIRPVVDLTRLL